MFKNHLLTQEKHSCV